MSSNAFHEFVFKSAMVSKRRPCNSNLESKNRVWITGRLGDDSYLIFDTILISFCESLREPVTKLFHTTRK